MQALTSTSPQKTQERDSHNIVALEFNQATIVAGSAMDELNIAYATRLSEHPHYRDSYFSMQFRADLIGNKGIFYEITRLKLDPPPVKLDPPPASDVESIDSIIERLTPQDCHFRIADIMAIGKKRLGLRHVSSHKDANVEKERGMRDGCSLNISFCKADTGGYGQANKYEDLHMKTDEEIAKELPRYEKAIDGFISDSIMQFDLNAPEDGGATLQHLLDSAKKTAFMVLKYSKWNRPCDSNSWGEGLGRFPKCSLQGTDITVLKALDVDSWDIQEGSRKQYAYLMNKVVDFLVLHYRKGLLDHIRTLDPNQE